MKRTAFFLALILVLMLTVTAFAAPQKCAKCGQDRFFMVFCSGQHSHYGAAECMTSNDCVAYSEYYRMLFQCPNCPWNETSDAHKHAIIHSICSDEDVCPFKEDAPMLYYPRTETMAALPEEK